MSKKPVTDAELSALAERALDLIDDLRAAEDRIRSNIACDASDLTRRIQTFVSLAAAASDFGRTLIVPVIIAEDQKRCEADLAAWKETL